ncbi:MAG: WD40 repeat domain-containing protein [Methanoregula sp.]|uniref:WD40 repeat domain-containing protein n=1 Tax=Methanoregula sp. TaxID=2052170 RepID=UPI002600B086|nr:WD40 repeat domain-containing protein [Methanoregula sp.]MCK9631358.1 WD40 repeat domain-containing protein [Methanoregula sp.]
MKISPDVPVIGPLLCRRSARAIAGAVKNGNIPAVRDLVGITSTSIDDKARTIALDALNSLSSQEAIDVFCGEVLDREDPALEELAVAHRYTPSVPGSKALFLYVTGQAEALCRFDPGTDHPLLSRGYTAAPERIKARALRSASDSRRGRILAHALTGAGSGSNPGTWSYSEWEVVLSGLTGEGAWDDLWQLVVSAPPSLAITVLNDMKGSGWRPDGDARKVFDELVRDLPDVWASPAPERPLVTIRDQDSRVVRLSFSRDGTLLATGNCNGEIAVWQVSSARLLTSSATGTGSISFLAFTPDNTYLITGGDQGTLHCSDIPSGDTIWSYADENHRISSIIVSGNGDEIIAGDHAGTIIRIGCRTGKTIQAMQVHPSPVTALSPAPDGEAIVAGHADGTVSCRDYATGRVRWEVPGTGEAVLTLAIPVHEGHLFVEHERSLPVLRNMQTGEVVRTYTGHSGHAACHAISADHRIVATGSDDHVLRFRNVLEKNPCTEISLYNRLATCCVITPDSTLAVAGCHEGTTYFFSIHNGETVKEFRGYKQPVTACAISPDGALLATAGGEGAVTLRSIPSGELLRTLRRPAGAVTAIAISPGAGNAGIVAGTADGMVRIYSRDDGTLIRSIDMYTPSVRALVMSSDGTYLACAGSDSSVRIWDLAKGSLLATCEGLKTSVRCLAFMPDATTCISGGWDGIARSWDVPGGTLSGTRNGHSSIITCCCVDPKGQVLVTTSNDTTVRIWQPDGEKDPVIIRDARKEVSSCTISEDGTLLATAGLDPVIRLYNLPEGTPAGTIPQVPGKPTGLAFTGDGLAIAAGYDTGTLVYYSVHERSLIRTVPAHAGAITGIAIVQDEDLIVTSGIDGMIRIFRLPFMRPLSQTTLADLTLAREYEQEASTETIAAQWRFLHNILSIRFQNEIGLCPAFRDAGIYDIQIVG